MVRRVSFEICFVALWTLTLASTNQVPLLAQKDTHAVPSDEAKKLREKGRQTGARGDYSEALTLFTQAMNLAPDWPHPVYDRATTYLWMKNFEAALADYKRTLELAPGGFFTAHVAVDTLLREQRGEFPPGLYRVYLLLEPEQDRERRRTVLEELVEKFPRFAPGWQRFAELAATPHERLQRIEAGLAATPDPSTLGMLKLNQAATLQALGKRDAATEILQALVSDPKSTTSVRVLAKMTLTSK
jgi:tetratricopeptide (TPR) repeat protein